MNKEQILYNVMKSYADTKINETKEDIKKKQEKSKPGMRENVQLEDTFEMKVTKHSEDL